MIEIIENLKEQLQEDLLVLTDDYLIEELGEEYKDFDTVMCQVIVDACNKAVEVNKNKEEEISIRRDYLDENG